ncbi:hypothetical protein DFH06DRAFT_1154000 [Mycena polygramma]|nr:hypothetical protein DFH06DRAFT_1154000 [Mycena polygramma]
MGWILTPLFPICRLSSPPAAIMLESKKAETLMPRTCLLHPQAIPILALSWTPLNTPNYGDRFLTRLISLVRSAAPSVPSLLVSITLPSVFRPDADATTVTSIYLSQGNINMTKCAPSRWSRKCGVVADLYQACCLRLYSAGQRALAMSRDLSVLLKARLISINLDPVAGGPPPHCIYGSHPGVSFAKDVDSGPSHKGDPPHFLLALERCNLSFGFLGFASKFVLCEGSGVSSYESFEWRLLVVVTVLQDQRKGYKDSGLRMIFIPASSTVNNWTCVSALPYVPVALTGCNS